MMASAPTNQAERPDVVACLTHSAHVCSLCLSTDKTGVHVLPATSPA